MARHTTLVLLAILALPTARAFAQHEDMAMHMQPGADRMKVAIKSPADGSTISGDRLTLHVATTGFADRCDLAGTPSRTRTGHYHVLLDKSLVNMYCGTLAAVSLTGLQPGRHIITVVPAQNDHTEVEMNAASVAINFRPAHAQPVPAKAPAAAGAPSIRIVSPRPGEAVSGSFPVRVAVQGFILTCDEMGRADVPGHGHWHLNFDTMKGPMMGMMTMAGMSCEHVLRTSAAGLKGGSTHKIIVLLADNAHAPLMPVVADSVQVRIK